MQQKKFTSFMDMHSNGRLKEEPYEYIYIEAPKDEAIKIFYNRFGHNPNRVSCTCCGGDYSIDEEEDLEQATAFNRGCRFAYFKDGKEISKEEGWVIGKGIQEGCESRYVEEKRDKFNFSGGYIPLSEYLKKDTILVIYDKDIKPEERIGDVPDQGYVWME